MAGFCKKLFTVLEGCQNVSCKNRNQGWPFKYLLENVLITQGPKVTSLVSGIPHYHLQTPRKYTLQLPLTLFSKADHEV
jgi:hypothetical protein